MELIYHNFDKLDFSLKGALPQSVLDQLQEAKAAMQEDNFTEHAAITIGDDVQVKLMRQGAKGGYAYQFTSKNPDAQWLVKNNTNLRQWNIFVSIGSLELATSGYKKAIESVYEVLEALNAMGEERAPAREMEVSLTRVDYCFDFKSHEFQPKEENFIAPSRSKKKVHSEREIDAEYLGQFATYLRIGKNPNRSVVIYNKSNEVSEQQKPVWWKIWGMKKHDLNGAKIWRVEARAFKEALKRNELRTFEDFEIKISLIISQILQDIRYVTPNLNDTNKSRWNMKPFWQKSIEVAENISAGYVPNASHAELTEIQKSQKKATYFNQVLGNLIGLTCLHDDDPKAFMSTMEGLLKDVALKAQKLPDKRINKKYSILPQFSDEVEQVMI